ncbi:uncharacterized protein N7484_002855 [Penicillium longicatenatum]|uniref:uncharacterized protein n=1 Tax=Penicillium longicatenatum TaxID=1561947 RepID=UPI0025471269|nr:uncharacterized protein N7484_002855 [Penicillium longicatenatum]KAJ5649132.1 hypothetical protein N7484_002855 [Penicillium longicatenatum]
MTLKEHTRRHRLYNMVAYIVRSIQDLNSQPPLELIRKDFMSTLRRMPWSNGKFRNAAYKMHGLKDTQLVRYALRMAHIVA